MKIGEIQIFRSMPDYDENCVNITITDPFKGEFEIDDYHLTDSQICDADEYIDFSKKYSDWFQSVLDEVDFIISKFKK